jgi:hypothetical protein
MSVEAQQLIREYIAYDHRINGGVSGLTLTCFLGMLETGEATLADFEAAGVDLMQLANRFGSANCWTGTYGTVAAKLKQRLQQ